MISGLQFKFKQHHQPEIHTGSVTEVKSEITGLLADAASISHTSPVVATHLFRKRLKLYRAYLKLLRTCTFDDDLYKAANAFLRDMGRNISDVRDAHVRDVLLTEISHNQEFDSFNQLLIHLLKTNQINVTSLQKKKITDENLFITLQTALVKSRKIENFFSHLKPEANRLLTTFNDTVRASRDTYNNCSPDPVADDLHEWRKRLKDVQYQIEIIMGTERSQHLPLYIQVSEIGDILGQINDTHMITEWINSISVPAVRNADLPAFLSELKEQNKSVILLAMKKGEKLYSLTPEQLELQTTAWL